MCLRYPSNQVDISSVYFEQSAYPSSINSAGPPLAIASPLLSIDAKRLLLGLEVVEENGALLGVLTPVLDNDARAVDDLAGVSLTVDLA